MARIFTGMSEGDEYGKEEKEVEIIQSALLVKKVQMILKDTKIWV